MDFGKLLYTAHKNEKSANKDIKCYKTKFEPPKKEVKTKTDLSANIKKFMQKREEEDRKKAEEEKKKKEELLALRSQDKKAYKRVQTMLKRTKSANKSVMEDAIDDVNTVVTMAGPQQCDEDDYGYVSQEASAFYAKLMDKYSSMPPEEPKFSQSKKPVVKDLNAAKDRVRAALQREEEEEMMPHKRKRKSKSDKAGEENGESERGDERSRSREHSPVEEPKPKKPKKMAPPPMDFNSLLKLAEQKQFEPIQIEKKVKEDEEERPMTKKQKLEYERERESRERRMQHESMKNGQRRPESLNRIPKLSDGGERKDKINGFGRIPKKSNPEGKPRVDEPDGNILRNVLKRKNSIDSDSNSRNNSDSDRSKQTNHRTDRPKSHQDSNRSTSNSDVNRRTESSHKNYERKSTNPSQASITANKAKSRNHNMSDEEHSEASDSGYERSGSLGNDQNRNYKPDRSNSSNTNHRSNHNSSRDFSERNGYSDRPRKQSDNEHSDSQSGSDSRKYTSEKNRPNTSSYKQKPEVKYKPDTERSMSQVKPSKTSSGRPTETSRDRPRSPNDRYKQSYSDSEPDDDKYRPSKVQPSSYEKKSTLNSRPIERSRDRSRSPETPKYEVKRKHPEADNGEKYVPSKKVKMPSSKEKKLMSLFEGSDEEFSSSHDNSRSHKDIENRNPKPSFNGDRQKPVQLDSKFKIPKANSNADRQKVVQKPEKYKSSEYEKTNLKSLENVRSSSSSSSKPPVTKEVSKQPTNLRPEKSSNSKPDLDKNRISVDKSKEKPRSSNNESPKPLSSSDNTKKVPSQQSAEEMLKKNANVWSKPCNLSPSAKPSGSGLSASQIERLRQMNKKPTPAKTSTQSPRDERTSDGRPLLPRSLGPQGKPSLLKAAAAAAASRAASQRAQTNSDTRSEKQPSTTKQLNRQESSAGASNKPRDLKDSRPKQFPPSDLRPKQFPPNDLKPKQFPPSDLRPKQFPPSDLKPRPFPPKDVRGRQFPPADVKRKPKPRRIESESEEEYDSEMDDFIDDGSDMNMEQISKEIQSIFGYDKSRFMGMEEDDECMESNFGQIDQEELRSLKIGLTEDWEDMKKEMEEKRAKARRRMELMKKKR
ncbi:protein SPT2 homolog [Homalodisca vitripennis]|uniref:protein SPT2 homolog n=1 Tax=Homalodisca vitripennis TaxID=197043 RepID=UPI001EEB5F78|nr:protein SPT2 homolog [Homalodisca vitripennis]